MPDTTDPAIGNKAPATDGNASTTDDKDPAADNRLDHLGLKPPPGAQPFFRVADVFQGKEDSAGCLIERVFVKKEEFAIYQTDHRVVVQFSDDALIAAKQTTAVNQIMSLRHRLDYLANGAPGEEYYNRQLASALEVAMEGNLDQARQVLNDEIANATEDRARTGRKLYLLGAGAIALVLAVAMMVPGGLLRGGASATGMLLLSAGGGAIGAMLSIAVAIRSRTVAPDHDWTTNLVDGGLRVTIGVIAGFALNLLLTGGFIGALPAGTPSLPSASAIAAMVPWKAALGIGFLAGFVERLVPDLLDKQRDQPPAKTTDP